ncbi:glycosyltransferase [Epidermidibacterium keratini]|uniref:Glucosyl-3-phosphoglycerate synthase n=1 Tax=Epidermidibacterium keratini TaxID=1891644 RepID=A0A7L4YQN4_9ACTN|nr:glycosyltransferase family 2 protein [Epidermidibacterium keratini]QHC01342.1 glycosyltransferase [Epidermidibacterium keratini]
MTSHRATPLSLAASSLTASSSTPPNVAAVVPAKDESERIARTIDALWSLPSIDQVVVVDDGSSDDTYDIAREYGANTFRHPINRGKAAAMQTGAAVVEMLDDPGAAHLLLFVDADLAETAVELDPLIGPVASGQVDMTIANLPPQQGASGHGIVTGFARSAITQMTGWVPRQPLSGQRCLTRETYRAASPLAYGWGVETALTIDALLAGYAVQEVPCDLRHRATGNDLAGQLHRARQYRDVLLAVGQRRMHGVATHFTAADQRPGERYTIAALAAVLLAG